jgi:hypothetical protein
VLELGKLLSLEPLTYRYCYSMYVDTIVCLIVFKNAKYMAVLTYSVTEL